METESKFIPDNPEVAQFLETELGSELFRFCVLSLSKNDDIAKVLRGHILIEEALLQLLEKASKNPQILKKANLRFNALLCVVEALYWKKEDSFFWEKIRELNEIRNTLAHHIDVERFKEKIDRFIKSIANRLSQHRQKTMKEKKEVSLGIGILYSFLRLL